jgi:hypothetical protein
MLTLQLQCHFRNSQGKAHCDITKNRLAGRTVSFPATEMALVFLIIFTSDGLPTTPRRNGMWKRAKQAMASIKIALALHQPTVDMVIASFLNGVWLSDFRQRTRASLNQSGQPRKSGKLGINQPAQFEFHLRSWI